ncbi:MAG: LacI family DNA-binding transcriptional regulator [Ardenticatenia bacterium]|nr:LacI family DNA-binding transcriptional regulator [Ardenticatenia bacterium]
MSVTIRDVAKRAGVPLRATVSKVLNGRLGVRKATREKVLQAARELGYIPDFSARSLVTKRTRTLGFLVHARHTLSPHAFYGEVLSAAEQEARKHQYHFLFATFNQGDEAVPLTLLQEQRVEGLILAGCDIPRSLIVQLKHGGVPLVLVDNHVPGVHSVVIDNEGGAYEATSHLIRLGYTKIGFLCEWLDDLSFSERFAGYKRALHDHGLPFRPELVAEGEPRTPGSGHIAAQRLLDQGPPGSGRCGQRPHRNPGHANLSGGWPGRAHRHCRGWVR